MSILDPNKPAADPSRTVTETAATFVLVHEAENGMGLRSMTVERSEEMRRLADGRGIREIARALNCTRPSRTSIRCILSFRTPSRNTAPQQ